MNIWSKIIATGSYIPNKIVKNEDLLSREFFDSNMNKIAVPSEEILRKFSEITGIMERRYVDDNLVTSDIAYYSALDTIETNGIDRESLDMIIVAHNFGDVRFDNRRSDLVPSLAARVKKHLEIKNPYTVCYDILFGCPGWLQGMLQADNFIKCGRTKRVLVIGAETLSRVSDPFDRDSLIYADGAGAVILEGINSETPTGILSHISRSDTINHSNMLWMGRSYNPDFKDDTLFLKMSGHNLYKYALSSVPGLVRESLELAGLSLEQINKVFIHQANNKMDEEILKRLFGLYGIKELDTEQMNKIMPMTISWLGNSSVATIPTLLDLQIKGLIDEDKLVDGAHIVFASVGAGMNINSMVYKF